MKFLRIILIFLPLMAVCCTNLDEINNRLDALETRVDRVEEAIASLRAAYDAGKIVTAVTPLADGWTIVFSDGSSINVYNGKDGQDGADGKDGQNGTDGKDGQDGADGKDGLTPPVPLLQVTPDGFWTVSYDNGITYEPLLGADGEPVRAIGRDGQDGIQGFPGEPGWPGEPGADGKDGEDGKDGRDGNDGLCVRVVEREGKYVFELYDPADPAAVIETVTTPLPSDPSAVIIGISKNPVNGEVTITLADGSVFTFGTFTVAPTSIVLLGAGSRGLRFQTVSPEVTFDFRVNPSNANLNLSVGSEGCQASLDLVGSYASRAIIEPENFALKSIAPVYENGERREGQYRATIARTQRVDAFEDDVVLVISYTDANGDPASLSSEPVTVSWDGHDYSAAFTTGLPVVNITLPDYAPIVTKDPWNPGAKMTITMPDGSEAYSGTLSVKGRGNSTWNMPKRPYALKLDKKAEILGMPAHKRWCLLANWMDRTLLRNDAAFAISRATGLAYTPRGQFVELVLNGVHIGNYYLCEQIKVDENRVNITKLKADELTGGYLFELDTNYDEEFKFTTDRFKHPWMFKDPDEDITPEQMEYVQNYANSLEEILMTTLRVRSHDYEEYIDPDTFIDWWFVYELGGNSEPYHPKSVYMYKDRGGLLCAGPVWDFDWGTFLPENSSRYVARYLMYMSRLFMDTKFVQRVKERWAECKPRLEEVAAYISDQAALIAASDALNHELWPIRPELNQLAYEVNGDADLSFDDAVARLIKAYSEKLVWLDTRISAM
ncbi:MAG: CotH kinase family protein [Muribaculaceae bacterium]|nr:CotH kinase family protein [Muribaculaceae bacterium]